jgi:hypothetical protein
LFLALLTRIDAVKILRTLTIVATAFVLYASGVAAQEIIPLSAGVGEEDRAPRPEYSTKLVFFVASGAYLADVSVVISRKTDNFVLKTKAEGPWLFVNLPAGHYDVQATRSTGAKVGVAFDVQTGAAQKQVSLQFPGND